MAKEDNSVALSVENEFKLLLLLFNFHVENKAFDPVPESGVRYDHGDERYDNNSKAAKQHFRRILFIILFVCHLFFLTVDCKQALQDSSSDKNGVIENQ